MPPGRAIVWSGCNRKIQKRSSEREDFRDIFSDLLRVLDRDDLERVAVVARAIWFRRNAVFYGRQIGQPYTLVSQALENLEAFQDKLYPDLENRWCRPLP
jgi:hypothetical protein